MQVCAVTRGGAFAEEVCLNEGAVLKLPSGVDIISAAGVQPDRTVLAWTDKLPFVLRRTWWQDVLMILASKHAFQRQPSHVLTR